MRSRIVTCEIDGVELPLLFTLGAEMEIAERLGGMDTLFDAFTVETPEEKIIREGVEAQMSEKKRQQLEARRKGQKDILSFLPFVVAALARQGQLLGGERDHGKLITEDWVKLHAMPGDVERMTIAMCEALSAGMGMSHEANAGDEVDLVQEALEKNGAGAAE